MVCWKNVCGFGMSLEYFQNMNDLRMSTGVFTFRYNGLVQDLAEALDKLFCCSLEVSDWTTKTLRRQSCLIDLLHEVPPNIT